jgi:hypothetical protein
MGKTEPCTSLSAKAKCREQTSLLPGWNEASFLPCHQGCDWGSLVSLAWWQRKPEILPLLSNSQRFSLPGWKSLGSYHHLVAMRWHSTSPLVWCQGSIRKDRISKIIRIF